MYVPAGFTEEQEEQVLSRGALIEKRLGEIIARQKEEESRRRWTLIVGGIGALLAAARLGIVALPFFKERRSRLGRLGE